VLVKVELASLIAVGLKFVYAELDQLCVVPLALGAIVTNPCTARVSVLETMNSENVHKSEAGPPNIQHDTFDAGRVPEYVIIRLPFR
jgi:hypothetical protein